MFILAPFVWQELVDVRSSSPFEVESYLDANRAVLGSVVPQVKSNPDGPWCWATHRLEEEEIVDEAWGVAGTKEAAKRLIEGRVARKVRAQELRALADSLSDTPLTSPRAFTDRAASLAREAAQASTAIEGLVKMFVDADTHAKKFNSELLASTGEEEKDKL